jgi:hypothetical protein
MPEHLSNLKAVPNSSIQPMSFICIDGHPGLGGFAGIFVCRQATSTGDQPIGVSQTAYDLPAGLVNQLTGGAYTTQQAALAGEPLEIYYGGDVCPLQLGVGGCTSGAALGPDSSGNGIMVAWGSNAYFGAIAFQNGAQGEVVSVLTWFGKA